MCISVSKLVSCAFSPNPICPFIRCSVPFVTKAHVHLDVISNLLLTLNVIIDKMAAEKRAFGRDASVSAMAVSVSRKWDSNYKIWELNS